MPNGCLPSARGPELGRVIAGAHDKMLRVIHAQPRPFIATISKAGVATVIDS